MAITRLRVTEGAAATHSFQITDVDGAAVAHDSLTTLTLTLYDLDTYDPSTSPAGGIINGRDSQDVLALGASPLGSHGVTFQDNGYVRWDLTADDSPIQTARRQIERHMAVFVATWDGGTFTYQLEIDVLVIRSST